MGSKFDSSGWHAAMAEVIAAGADSATGDALAEAIDVAVSHEGTCLLAFHRNAAPDVLHHTLEPKSRKHYLDRYLAGPYLLDPLYELAMQADKPELCRFRDAVPDRFRSSEYYRQYCERTHLLDEMDFLAEVSPDTTIVLVVGRRTRRFSRAELDALTLIEPVVQAGIRKAWALHDGASSAQRGAKDVHLRLTECFTHFGEAVLTVRERQISQLLLRGHSSKSVARELDIAPGTVMVHKRNLFSKLGISSQYELFSLFIDELGR